MTKRERMLTGVIIVLSLIILFGTSFFASEMKNCNGIGEDDGNASTGRPHNLIGPAEYLAMLKADGPYVIFIGRPTCPYSNQQDPILREIAEEYDIVINYLNIDEQSEADMAEVMKTYEDFVSEPGISTPTIIILKDKKVFDVNDRGLLQKAEMISYLRSQGVIK